MDHVVDSPLERKPPRERRSFLVRAAAIVVGAIIVIFPFAAGLGVLLDPLRRQRAGGNESDAEQSDLKFVRVTTLDALPADGMPRQFALTADVINAWTRAAAQRVGSVFLSRTDSDDGSPVRALSSVCPHLGCAVDFDAVADQYECPCHASAFALDGAKLFGPSLRGLDPLKVKLVDSDGRQEVWVAPERFLAGVAERVPIG